MRDSGVLTEAVALLEISAVIFDSSMPWKLNEFPRIMLRF